VVFFAMVGVTAARAAPNGAQVMRPDL
jgi:hypothetical protein